MNKVARLLCLSFAAAVISGLAGCAHRPAYSQMDANKASVNQNQNAERQATASTPVTAEPQAKPAPVAPPAPPPAAFKSPSFLDQASGGIKDLPAYPKATRMSVQLGPVEGVNTMALTYATVDPMNQIVAFYEKVIKENKWTVADKIVDPEFSEWNLKKGEENSAKVQVKKDQQTSAMNIVMVRGEKLETPGK